MTETHPTEDGSQEPKATVALTAAAISLVLGALVYVVSETVVAHAWLEPRYSYSGNYISDLGNPTCGPYDGRVVCSPLHSLMNWAFAVHGGSLGLAVWLLAGRLEGRSRTVLLTVGALAAAGFVLTGAVHSSPESAAGRTLWLHYLGATLAILGGNAIAILVGRQRRRLHVPAAAGHLGVVLGVAGVAAALVWLATFGLVPPGIPERVAVYTFVLWQVAFGGVLLHLTRPLRALIRTSATSTRSGTGSA